MGEVSSLLAGRFMRLPRRSDERGQGGLMRLPSWVDEPDGPFRPWAAVWVSRSTGLVHAEIERERSSHDWTLSLDALIAFGLKRGLVECWPAVLEVADEDLGHRVREALGDRDLEIALAPGLPAVQEVLAAMSEPVEGRRMPAGALDGAGVTVDRMRAFAVAARRFWEAAPWRYLGDKDLVEIEAAAALPDQDPETYAFGSEEEAVIAARTLAEAWSATPGAAAWLAAAGGGGRGGSKKRRQ